ncbi:MAG: type I secretion system permease/ATPase [Porticoccaceae bacterium]|nr:type I secretion system permease/ATPase [Porticoccaceae bacterium]
MKTISKNDLQTALRLCKRSFIAAGVFSFFINLLMLVPPFYMLQVYDRVVTSGNTVTLTMLTLIMVFLLATMGGLEWVRSRILVRISSRLDSLLGDKLYDVSYKQSLYSGGTVTSAQPLQDLSGIRMFMTGNGFFAFFDAPWLPLYMAVMFMFHPLFGLVGVFAAVVLVIIAVVNEKMTAKLFAEAAKEQQVAQNVAMTNLRNAEVIESMGMLDNIRARWRERNQKSLYWQSVASDNAGILTSVSKVFRLVVQSLVLGIGAWLVIHQEITPGLMIAGSILLGRALAPIDLLIGSWKGFVTARTQYERLNKLLDQIPPDSDRMSLPAPKGAVRMEQALIGPPTGKTPVIKGVSFAIQPGETVAVIGPSAAGKSTLARGMLGIWPTMGGKIRLDGAEVTSYNRDEIGPYLGYLPQDIELFDGTISENIARFGEVDPDKVVAAAQAAGVHEMILRLPQGYDTPIGQSGGALSGGQRQRIGLARALYGDPVLVVLDEPNSNLDDQGEQALAQAVQKLKQRGCTTVLITHRPSILGLVDNILVLAEGQVAAYGPRDKVLEHMRSGGAKPATAAQQAKPQPAVVNIAANATPANTKD